MGRKGDCFSSVASIVSDLGRFWPIGRGSWVSLFKLLLLLFGELWLCHYSMY